MANQGAMETTPTDDDLRAFTITQVLERVPIGRTKLYEEIRESRLPIIKIGSRTLITAGAFHAWLYQADNDDTPPYVRLTARR